MLSICMIRHINILLEGNISRHEITAQLINSGPFILKLYIYSVEFMQHGAVWKQLGRVSYRLI